MRGLDEYLTRDPRDRDPFASDLAECRHGNLMADDGSGCDDCDLEEFAVRIVQMSATELEAERQRVERLIPHEFFRAELRTACLTAIESERMRRCG